MVKKVLEIEDNYDFSLLGISSHVKDYRLCWELNNSLDISLEKSDPIILSEEDDFSGFATSTFYDDENQLVFVLVTNKNQGKCLIPEYSQIDYLLKVSGSQHEFVLKNKKQIIQNIESILKTIEINPNELKSKPNMVF